MNLPGQPEQKYRLVNDCNPCDRPWPAPPADAKKLDRTTLESRLHDKAPFGVVQSKMNFKVERDGNVRKSGVLTLNVLEVTQNAKSELPDQK